MHDIDDIVESIRGELNAWHATPAGRQFDAPAWWQGIHQRLDDIKLGQQDPKRLDRTIVSLEYLMLELGPLSPTIAPSFVRLKEIVNRATP